MDFEKIKNEYLTSDTTYKALAEKYSVPYSAIKKTAAAEKWAAQKKDMPVQSGDRIKRTADRLLGYVELAAEQLDKYIVKNKLKTKTVTYYDETGKVEKEIIEENESVGEVVSIIDKAELKQLVTTLKDLKEIHSDAAENADFGEMESLIRGIVEDE